MLPQDSSRQVVAGDLLLAPTVSAPGDIALAPAPIAALDRTVVQAPRFATRRQWFTTEKNIVTRGRQPYTL